MPVAFLRWIILLLYSVHVFSCASDPDFVPSDFLEILKSSLDTFNISMQSLANKLNSKGVSMAVVYDQEILWDQGFGLANIENKSSLPNLDTVFRVASLSKVFVGLELYALRDLGILNIDDAVTKYIPAFSIKPPLRIAERNDQDVSNLTKNGGTIRLGHLASHMSGLPREAPCLLFGGFNYNNSSQRKQDVEVGMCNINHQEALTRIAAMRQIMPTETIPLYSDLGFALLANVLEAATKLKYEDLLERDILKPFGMTSTGININKAPRDRLAKPYQSSGVECPSSFCLANLGWCDPHGGMFSTTRDIASLLSTLFREVRKGPLQTDSVRESILPVYIDTDYAGGFAMPWELYKHANYWVSAKSGEMPGYSAMTMFVRNLKLGIVVMANTPGVASEMAFSALSALLPDINGHRDNAILDTSFSIKTHEMDICGIYFNNENMRQSVSIHNEVTQTRSVYIIKIMIYGTYALQPVDSLHTYRLVPVPGTYPSCHLQEINGMYSYVYFNIKDNTVVSVSIPGLFWGVLYMRKIS